GWMALTPAYGIHSSTTFEIQSPSSDIKLIGPSTHSREGYFNLTISASENGSQRFVVERSGDETFASVIEYPLLGDARTITLSGFADGDYFFRAQVRNGDAAKQNYSNAIKVTVQHYPIWQAAA